MEYGLILATEASPLKEKSVFRYRTHRRSVLVVQPTFGRDAGNRRPLRAVLGGLLLHEPDEPLANSGEQVLGRAMSRSSPRMGPQRNPVRFNVRVVPLINYAKRTPPNRRRRPKIKLIESDQPQQPPHGSSAQLLDAREGQRTSSQR